MDKERVFVTDYPVPLYYPIPVDKESWQAARVAAQLLLRLCNDLQPGMRRPGSAIPIRKRIGETSLAQQGRYPRSARLPRVPLQGRGPQVGRGGAGGADWLALRAWRFPSPAPRPSLAAPPLPHSLSPRGRAQAGPAVLRGRGQACVPPPYRSSSLKHESDAPPIGEGVSNWTASGRGGPEPTKEGLRQPSRRDGHASVLAPTE